MKEKSKIQFDFNLLVKFQNSNSRIMNSIKFSVYGKLVMVERTDRGWEVFYPGADGKRGPAQDIVIPDFVGESELENYLSDLCHEWATVKHPAVRRLE